MALGKFADRNYAQTSLLSDGVWLAGLPLTNMLDATRYVSAPARCATPANLAASRFDADLQASRAIDLVGLMFHNLSVAAKYRLTIRAPGGTFASPAYQTPWTDVFGRAYSSSSLLWEDSNWWLGQVADEDLALRPQHLWIAFDAVAATGVRVELDDKLNPAGYVDIGGLWISGTWSPGINFERGRELGLSARDLVDEAPSGRLFGERRQPRRQLTLTLGNLTTAETYRMADMAARARTTDTVVVIPDAASVTGLAREAFPAVLERPPSARFTHERQHQVVGVFKEIIA